MLVQTTLLDLGFHDDDFFDRTITRTRFHLTHLINHIHPFNHFTKNRVLAIEEVVIDEVDKELGTPGIGTGVCHGDGPAIVPVTGWEFIRYRVTRAAATGPGRVASLNHETVDNTVEDYTVIVAFLYKSLKIARGDGHIVSKGNPDRAHVRFERYGFSCWCCHDMLEEYTIFEFICVVNPRLVNEKRD
jgi:hypothetical protein